MSRAAARIDPMDLRYGVSLFSPMLHTTARPGKYHILGHQVAICGVRLTFENSPGLWDNETAIRLAEKLADRYPERGFCKRCSKAVKKLRPILERMAEI